MRLMPLLPRNHRRSAAFFVVFPTRRGPALALP